MKHRVATADSKSAPLYARVARAAQLPDPECALASNQIARTT